MLNRKRVVLIAAIAFIMISATSSTVRAESSGWERYSSSHAQVTMEYFPIVPYDSAYPTASDEFPIKFDFILYDWWEGWILWHFVPAGFAMDVYYYDSSGTQDYVTWKRWLPVSTSQNGAQVSFTLGGKALGLSIMAPSGMTYMSYNQYTTQYNGVNYLHLSHFEYGYWYNAFWGTTETIGAGSISIMNGLAQAHQGDHVLIWVQISLLWQSCGGLLPGGSRGETYNFVFGDDIPASTDCWLTVQPGTTGYSGP